MARLCATSFRGSAPGAFPIAPITCVVAMAAPIDALRVKKPKNTRRSALHQCGSASVGVRGPYVCIHSNPPRQVYEALMLLEACWIKAGLPIEALLGICAIALHADQTGPPRFHAVKSATCSCILKTASPERRFHLATDSDRVIYWPVAIRENYSRP